MPTRSAPTGTVRMPWRQWRWRAEWWRAMNPPELLASGPVLTDGAWGTELQGRGLGVGDCPDHWNLLRPDAVADVARAYVEAGSRVILTNTFRGNRVALSGYGLE